MVETLQKQCLESGIKFEILCFDDLSTNECIKENRKLNNFTGIKYIELEKNYGRAAIRNLLVRNAKYPFLIFLDGDSGIENSSFIENYLKELNPNKVLYGGRYYAQSAPESQEYILHWKYGTKNEALAKAERMKSPYLNFQTNNFLISKAIFEQILFDESISGYGYEDLLFAKQLQKLNINIVHLDNQVIHLDLEPTPVFLKKTEKAMHNLSLLYTQNKLEETRLIDIFKTLKSLKLLKLINYFTFINKKRFLENLYSRKPNLRYFSLLKLWLFSQFINGQEGSFDL